MRKMKDTLCNSHTPKVIVFEIFLTRVLQGSKRVISNMPIWKLKNLFKFRYNTLYIFIPRNAQLNTPFSQFNQTLFYKISFL